MNDCTLSGVDTLFSLLPTSRDVNVSGCVLLGNVNSPTLLVNNSSPYPAGMANNYWGASYQAITGIDGVSGAPTYALSNFVRDVFSDISLGLVTFLPFAPAPPPVVANATTHLRRQA